MNAPIATLQPGIHTIPADRYHADPAPEPSLSNTMVKTVLKTPRHAWIAHPRLNPDYRPRPDSDEFDLGTAAHSLLLEGIHKAKRLDFKDWRSNDAKAERDAARAAGLIPMLPRQYEAVMLMHEAARDFIETTGFRGLLQRAKPEQSLVWKDPTHIWCRARLDLLDLTGQPLVLDYKTTAAEGPGDFMRKSMVTYGYDTQSLFYPRGLQELGIPDARFVLLVQETTFPFMCYLVEPAASMVELASHKLTRAMRLWRDCLHSNRWPGYSTEVHQAEAPVWALKEEEELL